MPMQPILCFIAGTKGGVGKSFAAAMLHAAAGDLKLKTAIFDSDAENSTIRNLLGEEAVFLDERKSDYPLDSVVNSVFQAQPADLTIVDMKAGTSRSTMQWFDSVPWPQLIPKVRLCIVGCVTSDPESVRTLGPWILYFDQMKFHTEYLIVKSEKDGRGFAAYDSTMPGLLATLKHGHALEVLFPAMDKNYITLLNNVHVTLKMALASPDAVKPLNTIMAQARLKNYYRAYADPLINVIATWLPQDMLCDGRKELIAAACERIRIRKGEIAQ